MDDGGGRATFAGSPRTTVGDPRQPTQHTGLLRRAGITSRLLPVSFRSRFFVGSREVEDRRTIPATTAVAAPAWPVPALSLA